MTAARRRRRAQATTADMLLCRTIGHAWYPYDAERRPSSGWLWVLRCERCTTARHDVLDLGGDLMSRHYEHPEGYRDAGLYENRADRRAALLAEREPTPPLRAVST